MKSLLDDERSDRDDVGPYHHDAASPGRSRLLRSSLVGNGEHRPSSRSSKQGQLIGIVTLTLAAIALADQLVHDRFQLLNPLLAFGKRLQQAVDHLVTARHVRGQRMGMILFS